MSCDVIDKIVDRSSEKGRPEGRQEGRQEISLLMKKLFAQKRIEDIRKACKDRDYFMQLMKEFGIV